MKNLKYTLDEILPIFFFILLLSILFIFTTGVIKTPRDKKKEIIKSKTKYIILTNKDYGISHSTIFNTEYSWIIYFDRYDKDTNYIKSISYELERKFVTKHDWDRLNIDCIYNISEIY